MGAGAGGIRPFLVLVVMFAVFIPRSMGSTWTGLPAIAIASLVALMGVLTIIPDSFAGERDRKTLETLLTSRLSDRAILLGKIAAVVVIGLGGVVVMLIVSLVVVNVGSHHGGLILYSPLEIAAALGAAALAGSLLANIGVLASLRAPSVMAAQKVMGLGVFAIGALGSALVTTLPDGFKTTLERLAEQAGTESPVVLVAVAVVVLVVVNVALFAVTTRLFRRPKLVGA
jgi:ABC-2 type transport system permease protein